MDSDNEYEADSGEEDSYDYTGEESNPEEATEDMSEERCRFDWQDEELDNKERGEHPMTTSTIWTIFGEKL